MKSMQEPKKGPDLVRSNQVWVQLGELFGKSFYREHGMEPTSLWMNAVSRLTDQEIMNGLANLANDALTFPANLSQFVSACKREKPVRFLGVKSLIEDKRNIGNMSRLEWMELNDE